jgi:hypothetical protein
MDIENVSSSDEMINSKTRRGTVKKGIRKMSDKS